MTPPGLGDLGLFDVCVLESNPGCERTLYLDFDGHTTTGTAWNRDYKVSSIETPCFSLDDDVSADWSVKERAAIYEIWLRVSEDYLPFDLNVTTIEPEAEAFTEGLAQRICIGGTYEWYGSEAGGIAYRGTFTQNSDTPGYVFSESLVATKTDPIKVIAEDITHEAGHTFELIHDGSSLISGQSEYYRGANGWGPIMGYVEQQELTQWSKGEYAGAQDVANGTVYEGHQDDLAIIGAVTGYRPDDHGDTLSEATAIALTDQSGYASGIIGLADLTAKEDANTDKKDVDWFTFTGDGATLDFWIGGMKEITNLDFLVTLYDADGNRIDADGALSETACFDPTDTLYVTFTLTTEANAVYYLSVEGTGRETSVKGIYSDYGSLGWYEVIIGTPSALTLTVTTDEDVFDGSDGKLSLREALALAGERSVIVFDSALSGKTITLLGGEIALNKSVTIDASALLARGENNAPIPGVTLSANGKSQIFSIARRNDSFNADALCVALIGLSLTGGAAPSGSGTTQGGAIFNTETLTISACVFSDNSAVFGGAIYAEGDSVTVTVSGASIFSHNEAETMGGAVCVAASGVFLFQEVTFTHNTAGSEAKDGYGGGIFLSNASAILTLERALFRDNSASLEGGALEIRNGVARVSDSEFSGNSVTADNGAGGGIAHYDALEITHSTFENNTAEQGGAIFNKGDLTVETSDFGTNEAERGGALYNSGHLVVAQSTFTQNTAYYGGGILSFDDAVVSDSFFGGNSANDGGAIFHQLSLTLIQSVMAGNFAARYGGGLYVTSGANAVVRQTTIVGNGAAGGGGGIVNFGTLDLSNSILAYNKNDEKSDDLTANIADAVRTTARGSLILAHRGKALDTESTGNRTEGDPAFMSWSDYDFDDWNNALYRDWDLRPTGESAAVDLGLPDADGELLSTDLWGNLRVRGASIDAGAFEYGEYVTFTLAGQIGCRVKIPDYFADRTLQFDLDGDGVFSGVNDVVVSGDWLDIAAFAAYRGETITFRVSDDAGKFTSKSEIITIPCQIMAVPSLCRVRTLSLADGAVLKLTLDAQNPSPVPIALWRINWGDGGAPVEIAANASLAAAHYYAEAGTYTVTVETLDRYQTELGTGGFVTAVATHTVSAPQTLSAPLMAEMTASPQTAAREETFAANDSKTADTASSAELSAALIPTGISSPEDVFPLLKRLREANRRRWALSVDAAFGEC